MRRLKVYEEFLTNPFNPDEIWDKEISIDDIDNMEQLTNTLDNLIGKTVEFLSVNGGLVKIKVRDYELADEEGYQPDNPFYLRKYLTSDDGRDYEINPHHKIKILN